MKIFRYGEIGNEAFGIVDRAGGLRDARGALAQLAEGDFAGQRAALAALDADALPRLPDDVRLGCPLPRVGKIVCIGLNYVDHAAESDMALPTEPVMFMKAPSSLSGPNDDIRIPADAEKTDWEVELGVVIGKRATRVAEADALDHVAGYVVANDVSERAWQLERGGQWLKGKSLDSFCPVGPWFVSADEVPDPQALRLWLDVNGERRQDGTTANMVFPVRTIIHYVSQFMSLEPGDLILTGTPAGVGFGQRPPVYLRPGDVVELGIDGLGSQRQRVALI